MTSHLLALDTTWSDNSALWNQVHPVSLYTKSCKSKYEHPFLVAVHTFFDLSVGEALFTMSSKHRRFSKAKMSTKRGETTTVSLEEEAPEICPQLVPSFARKILRAPSLSCVQAENFHSKVFGEIVAQDAVRATQRKGNSHCKHLKTCAPTCRHYDGNCICKRDCILDTAKHEWATHYSFASVSTKCISIHKRRVIIHKALPYYSQSSSHYYTQRYHYYSLSSPLLSTEQILFTQLIMYNLIKQYPRNS